MPAEERCEALSAYRAGYPITVIAARLGRSYETIHLALFRDHGCEGCG